MIRRFVLSIVLFATAFTHATAADYYMAVDGSDVNAGTVDAPLKTFEKAFAVLNDGDTLILKGGAYSEPIDLDGFRKSVTVKAAPGEDVTLIGARRLEGEWQPWRDGTWKLEIIFNIWQLFIGDRLVQLARWPNASFDDGSIWRMTECMRNSDHGWNHKTSESTGQTQPGLIRLLHARAHDARSSERVVVRREDEDRLFQTVERCRPEHTRLARQNS